MEKIIKRYWVVIAGGLLSGVFAYGYHKMYFHQDDLDWFILANRPFLQVMTAPIGDHINYLFRILLYLEWSAFGFSFPGYLVVSVLMHAFAVYLLYRLVLITTKRSDLAISSALIFTINTNWTEIILWISGQTISITVIFVLWAMICVYQKKHVLMSTILAGWTSALALGLPIAGIMTYGYEPKIKKLTKVGISAVGSLILTAIIYLTKATDGTKVEMSISWGINVVLVWGLMVINTVVGRLFIPFDRLESIRIVLVVVGMLWGVYLNRRKLVEIIRDKWSVYLILQIIFYYLIVAAGRAQYGIGIMRAERYGYLGFALIILLVVRAIRNTKTKLIVWVIPLVILQAFGLYYRAEQYILRPQQLKGLIEEVKVRGALSYDSEAFLPHFVLNDERLKYGDLIKLLND